MLMKWTPFPNGGIARSTARAPVFDELFREADRLLDGTLTYPAGWTRSTAAPPADIYETQDELVLKMDLPGFDPKTLNIQVEGDVLTLQAQRAGPTRDVNWVRQERTVEQVARSFVLPNTVDASRCQASSEHGVLTLTLPKREEAKPRSITVKVQG
jgi:HSP20 family protein